MCVHGGPREPALLDALLLLRRVGSRLAGSPLHCGCGLGWAAPAAVRSASPRRSFTQLGFRLGVSIRSGCFAHDKFHRQSGGPGFSAVDEIEEPVDRSDADLTGRGVDRRQGIGSRAASGISCIRRERRRWAHANRGHVLSPVLRCRYVAYPKTACGRYPPPDIPLLLTQAEPPTSPYRTCRSPRSPSRARSYAQSPARRARKTNQANGPGRAHADATPWTSMASSATAST